MGGAQKSQEDQPSNWVCNAQNLFLENADNLAITYCQLKIWIPYQID